MERELTNDESQMNTRTLTGEGPTWNVQITQRRQEKRGDSEREGKHKTGSGGNFSTGFLLSSSSGHWSYEEALAQLQTTAACAGLLPWKSSYMIPNNSVACGSPEIRSFRSPWGMKESAWESSSTSFTVLLVYRDTPSRSCGARACRLSELGMGRGFPLESTERTGALCSIKLT